jgi:hypothetical protein
MQARLADVINRTRQTGPGNRRTTQFSYKSDISLSMTLKTEGNIFFVDHVFCIFKKELMKYVVLECVHVSVLYYIILFICLHSVFDQTPLFLLCL